MRRILVVVGLLALCVALCGCGPPEAATGPAERGVNHGPGEFAPGSAPTYGAQHDVTNGDGGNGPRTVPDVQAGVDSDWNSLSRGTLAYRAPVFLRVGQVSRITVRATAGKPELAIDGLPGEASSPDSHVVLHDISVGPSVRADLSGPADDFVISRVGGASDDGRRAVPSDAFAEWSWDVQPLQGGSKNLTVAVYDVGNPAGQFSVGTFSYPTQVASDWSFSAQRWLRDHAAQTGITAPFVVAGVCALLRRRKKNGRRAEDDTRERASSFALERGSDGYL